MTTYPLPTLACTVDASGISAPSYNDILLSLQASYRSIYGSDVILDPSTQDGQWIAIQAKAQTDSNNATIAAYNNASPATAFGAGLSSVVKINGIARLVSSHSSVPITIVGQAGARIIHGIVGDSQNLRTEWFLPSPLDIPPGGSITVTAVCSSPGAIEAAAGTLENILTPTAGWQTATNSAAAAPGAPVELDATLRQRQARSTQLPAQTTLAAIVGQLANLPGVEQVKAYENDTDLPDANGLPPHSICLSVLGGDLQSIVNIIGKGKAPGCDTFGGGSGAVSGIYTDPVSGIPYTISFNIPAPVHVVGVVTIVPQAGYSSAVGAEIINALVAQINALSIGARIQVTRLYPSALLVGAYASPAAATDTSTYELVSVAIAAAPATPVTADLEIAFNELADTSPSAWTIST